ncbi:MAG TPA: hypothetical protein VK061_03610 [Bacillota bacterium]|nr:hypothetical protein [Bacillota bacterium]
MNKIIINKPVIKKQGDRSYLVSKVEDGVLKTEKDYFFSVQEEFGDYLTHEVADAFLCAMLTPAILTGQNIVVKAPISEVLYYNLENSLIYTLCKVFNKSSIKVSAESLITPDFKPKAVSTGFSGGVDSFTTVIQHTSDECPDSLKLTHLSLMNVGSYGDTDAAFSKFENDSIRSKEYAEKLKLPLVLINSNIGSAYLRNECEFERGFASRTIISLISGILSLQKLYKYYFISSSRTIDKIKLIPSNQDYYEYLVADFLSTTNTRSIIANGDMDRISKIQHIVDYKDVQDRLYVCASDIYNEKHARVYNKDGFPNCSECVKCTRTMIVLDLLGKLDLFKYRFNLRKYEHLKPGIIEEIYCKRKVNFTSNLIYSFMSEIKYTIPVRLKLKYNSLRLLNKSFQILFNR